MAKNCLPLGELDRERIAEIDRRLGLKLDGYPMAANTANRIRTVARASVQSAMAAGAIAAGAWPRRPKTRARRKVARIRRSVDVRALPTPAAMAEAIDAIITQQPGSKKYRVMTAVAYYAGLRPSEVVMLRVGSAELPAEGWGRLDVTEADISFDESGEPKTGPRSVPIPPVLVAMLRVWVEQSALTSPERLLFRTRKRHSANRIELAASVASSARIGWTETTEGLRLPTCCGDYVATCGHATRRNGTWAGTFSRDAGFDVRRRSGR